MCNRNARLFRTCCRERRRTDDITGGKNVWNRCPELCVHDKQASLTWCQSCCAKIELFSVTAPTRSNQNTVACDRRSRAERKQNIAWSRVVATRHPLLLMQDDAIR